MGEEIIDEDVIEPTRMSKRQDGACEEVALIDRVAKTTSHREHE